MDERLEETACLVCGEEKRLERVLEQDAVVAGVAYRHTLVRCTCGFVFVRPRLKARVFDEHYRTYFSDPAKYEAERRSQHEAENRRAIDRLTAHGLPAGARLLEVGSGTGSFVEAAMRLGYEVTGLDPSPTCVEHLRAKGARAVQGWFDDSVPFEDGTFDAIVLIQTLEHFAEPLRALGRARRLARPGGLAAIEVPNVENVFTTWSRRLGRRDRTDTLVPGDHYSYFSARTIEEALRRSAWEPLETDAGFHEGILATRVPRLVALPVARLSRSLRWGTSLLAIARRA